MKRIQFLLLSFFVGVTSCDKSDYMVGGTGHIIGQILWQNDLLPSGSTDGYIKDQYIYLSKVPSDSINYLFRTRTDSLGRFAFTGLEPSTEYLLFYKNQLNGQVFTLYEKKTPSTDAVVLKATVAASDRQGVLLTITDAYGGTLYDAQAYFFKSKMLAESGLPIGSVYQGRSDTNGQLLQTSMSTGEWHAYVFFKNESILIKKIVSFTVDENKLNTINVVIE